MQFFIKHISGWLLVALLSLPLTLMAVKADFQFTRVCIGSETTLINRSSPADSLFKVLWDLNGDGRFGDAVTDTVRITFPAPGLYAIGLKVITDSGEADAIYHMVPVADVEASFGLDFSCRNLPVHFFDQSVTIADTIFQYIWNFGDGTPASFLKNPTHNYLAAGEFDASLVVVTLNGCVDSVTNTLTIKNAPVVDVFFSGDTVFPLGDSVTATILGTYDSIFWSTGERTSSIVIRSSGYYFVQGFLDGCYGQYDFSVTAIEDHTVRVMTVFTPNGDGFNDLWEVINIDEVAPCQVDVFNRWGEKVLSSSSYNNDWDGTFKGKSLTNDTYYYFLRCKDGILQKGTVNIVK